MRPKDLAALVVLAALWGGSYLFIRLAAPAFGPLPLAAGRASLAALVCGWGCECSASARCSGRTRGSC